MNRKTLLATVVALVTFACLLFAIRNLYRGSVWRESQELMIEARDGLHIGMMRDQVEPYVHTAWRHYLCDYERNSFSVYLFGSHDPDLAGILYLRFKKEKGVEKLDQIASYESYLLHEFDHCEIIEK